ncbi:MAG: SPOR domain-containing protein [Thermoleophilia bacterium]|nr:SPOR domain-containing protein [Thermoleophilia bacterium]
MSESRPTGWEGADRWFASGDGGAGEPAPDGDAPPPPPACAVCGAELEHDQTYCLECGSPTPLAPRLRRGGRTAALLAGGMIVLGLGGGALAFAVMNDDDEAAGTGTVTTASTIPLVPTGTLPTTPPPSVPTTGSLPADTSFTTPTAPGFTTPTTPGLTSGTLPSTTGFDTVTGPTTVPTTAPATTVAPTTTESIPTTTEEEADGSSDWPLGATAWTAILASTRSERDARSAKGRVADGGDPAGVLFSSDFSDLRPGYWVVFSGRYGSRDTAIAQAVKLRPEFPTAYARRIEG